MRTSARGAPGSAKLAGMHASQGDRISIPTSFGSARTGEIMTVIGYDGAPPYTVRFDADRWGVRTVVPGSGTEIHRRECSELEADPAIEAEAHAEAEELARLTTAERLRRAEESRAELAAELLSFGTP